MSHFSTKLSSQRHRTAFAYTYSEMTARIGRAYDHVTARCNHAMDLVVFRGTLWDSDYWDTIWEKHFEQAVREAKQHVKAGVRKAGGLDRLVIIQKQHRPKYQPSVVLDARLL